jgi:ATP-dependent DNA helicase RecG
MKIDTIKGIGPVKKKALEKLAIFSVEDLIKHYPKRYEPPKQLKKIMDCSHQEEVRLTVQVLEVKRVKQTPYGNERLHIRAQDDSGSMDLIFFNARFISGKVSVGLAMTVEGEFRLDGIKRSMIHPEWLKPQQIADEGVRPFYGLTEGISQADMRGFIEDGFKHLAIEDQLPQLLIAKARLMGKLQALREIHRPSSKAMYTAAKYRIVYEELFELQAALMLIKSKIERRHKYHTYLSNQYFADCMDALPYCLTEGQNRVLTEILEDLKSSVPMHRLLQGDVGSGKTIIALLSLLLAHENGHQSAMMVPTEVLAEQHYRAVLDLLPQNVHDYVVLLTSGTKNKKGIFERLSIGQPLMVIGTHALIEETVQFNGLALIITDEQHRFGVEQRMVLQEKGDAVDVLVMSATPIPRTLSMIRYGDMEISILDEMPVGRQPVATEKIKKQALGKLVKSLKAELESGHQLYFVCPLIEENETLDLQSADNLFEKLRSYYTDYTVALLHGKQKPQEKEATMRAFSENQIQVLVSTTVIEVGINVPNATVMCILNAERFGLAQLHQLRGRVGRGKAKGYCYLIAEGQQVEHNKRLEVLVTSQDGFYIAEKDLELRGPGELLGTRQHGLPELRLANFFKHQDILIRVQEDVKWVIESEELECQRYCRVLNEKLLL